MISPETKTQVSPKEIVRGQGITGFRTQQGSIYSYDDEGKTQRFKTKTGELEPTQNLTVFSDLSDPQLHEDFLVTMHGDKEVNGDAKVRVVERLSDDSGAARDSIDEVTDPDALYVAIIKNGQVASNIKATITPTVGYSVIDTRRYVENGQPMREIHLGNIVVDIFDS